LNVEYNTSLTEVYAHDDTKSVEEEYEEKIEDDEETEEITDGNSEDDDTDTEADNEDEYEEYEGFTFIQHQDALCSIQDKAIIPKSWILLYRQSMVNVFSYGKRIYICDAKQVLTCIVMQARQL